MNELEEMVSEICGRLELNLSPGYNYDIKHVKMTLEPIPFIHRPLIVYLFTGISNKMTDFFLLFSGFKRCESGPVRYWYRPAVSEIRTSKNPIVFFHGITSGWGVYWSMIKILSGQRETFLFDLDSVRVHSLQFKFLPSEIYCQHVMQALESHNVKKVSIVGHSFGSITSAWFVKQYPQYVDHLTLIDPVSLLLALPDVAYNFLYRKPSTFVEWLLHVMASREITVANALRRNFWWYKNVLWLEDIPSSIGVVVSVAGGDEITKAEAVKEYVELVANHRRERLTEIQKSRLLCSEDLKEIAPVSCLYYDGQSHAEILFRIEQLHEVSRVLGQHESRFKHL
jgi:pimeloyl-ACP methyl ester carboxylesterase